MLEGLYNCTERYRISWRSQDYAARDRWQGSIFRSVRRWWKFTDHYRWWLSIYTAHIFPACRLPYVQSENPWVDPWPEATWTRSNLHSEISGCLQYLNLLPGA